MAKIIFSKKEDLCSVCNKNLNDIEKIGKICNDCLKKEYENSIVKNNKTSLMINTTII